MMASLRRTRWIAALLVAFAPGAGGQVVAALHPCPAESSHAGVAAHHMEMGGGHQLASSSTEHSGHDGGRCACVSQCAAAAAVVAPTAMVVPIVPSLVVTVTPWQVIDASIRLSPLPERLPPSTAPPLV